MTFGDFTSHSFASPPFQRTPTPFTPVKHSPLTPRRNPNPNEQNHTPLSPPQSPPSLLMVAGVKRKHKPNPLMMSKDDMREKRRNIFLNKLKDAREQSRLQARGGEDEVCLYHICFTCIFSSLTWVDDADYSGFRTKTITCASRQSCC